MKQKIIFSLTKKAVLITVLFLISIITVTATAPNSVGSDGYQSPYFSNSLESNAYRQTSNPYYIRNVYNYTSLKTGLNNVEQPIINSNLSNEGLKTIITFDNTSNKLRASYVDIPTGNTIYYASLTVNDTIRKLTTTKLSSNSDSLIVALTNSSINYYNVTSNSFTLTSYVPVDAVYDSLRCYNVTGYDSVTDSESLRCGVLRQEHYSEYLYNGTKVNDLYLCSDGLSYDNNNNVYTPLIMNIDGGNTYDIVSGCGNGVNKGLRLEVIDNENNSQYNKTLLAGGSSACQVQSYTPSNINTLTTMDVNGDGIKELLVSYLGCVDTYIHDYNIKIYDVNGVLQDSKTNGLETELADYCNGVSLDVCYIIGSTPTYTADLTNEDLGEEYVYSFKVERSGGGGTLYNYTYVYGDDSSKTLYNFTLNDSKARTPGANYMYGSYYTYEKNNIKAIFMTTDNTVKEIIRNNDLNVWVGDDSNRLNTIQDIDRPYLFSDVDDDKVIDLVGAGTDMYVYYSKDYSLGYPYATSIYVDTSSPVCVGETVSYTLKGDHTNNSVFKYQLSCEGDGDLIESIYVIPNTTYTLSCEMNNTGIYEPYVVYVDEDLNLRNYTLTSMKVVNTNESACFYGGEGGKNILSGGTATTTSTSDIDTAFNTLFSGLGDVFKAVIWLVLTGLIIGGIYWKLNHPHPFVLILLGGILILIGTILGMLPAWITIIMIILSIVGYGIKSYGAMNNGGE